ncbi:MAG: thioredoxin-like domain-containing protein [Candidatus Zixiibacteriota bacterium]
MISKAYKIIIPSLVVFLCLSSCSEQKAQGQEQYGDNMFSDKMLQGNISAPEFPFGLMWLNTDRPLTLEEFRGKLILLDFWTFCCINCMHVLPDLKKLEEKYPEELVVIGVHSAKFTNEKDSEAIRQAILRYEIKHPVVNDHNFEVWSSYGARAWPTLVLINPNGKIIGMHSGEGIFEPFDELISKAIAYFDARGELKRSTLDLKRETRSANMLLSFPGKVKADPKSKRLVITDSNHNRILMTDPDGHINLIIGSGRQGNADGDFSSAEFNHPQGTFLDGDRLYIADTENHLIRLADLASGEVTTVLGTGKQARTYNQSGTGTDVALNSPWDLLVHNDKLYIAMAGSHQLWMADLKTLNAGPYAGSGREARIDGPLLQAALAQPSGITTDGKKLYFADSETSSIRAADLDSSGRVETIIGEDLFEYGDVDGPFETARLQHPLGIVYHDGLLYIADTYNSKIKVIDPARKTSTTLAGTGRGGYADGDPKNAQFNEPSGISVLDGKLYVADANNHLIRVVDLERKKVTTLNISGLDILARQDMQQFNGRTVEMEEYSIVPGDGVVNLMFRLPKGYKFTNQAPFYLEWKSEDTTAIDFKTASSKRDSGDFNPSVSLPLHALKGKSRIIIDAVIYFCQENSTICLFDNVRIILPVDIAESAGNEISLGIDVSAAPLL